MCVSSFWDKQKTKKNKTSKRWAHSSYTSAEASRFLIWSFHISHSTSQTSCFYIHTTTLKALHKVWCSMLWSYSIWTKEMQFVEECLWHHVHVHLSSAQSKYGNESVVTWEKNILYAQICALFFFAIQMCSELWSVSFSHRKDEERLKNLGVLQTFISDHSIVLKMDG